MLLGLFVPWHQFLELDSVDPNDVYREFTAVLPARVKQLIENVKLLHKSAEDAKKDASLWASRSEGDEGVEFDKHDESVPAGGHWCPDPGDQRNSLYDVVSDLVHNQGVTFESPHLKNLLQGLEGSHPRDSDEEGRTMARQTTNNISMPRAQIKSVKAAQDRLHKQRMIEIQGDEPEEQAPQTGAETGFGDEEAVFGTPPPTADAL